MVKIHQQSLGQGPTIVLVHGWAMHSGIWKDFAEKLAQHHRVICLDLPGHGQSEALEDFNLADISAALVAAVPEGQFCWLGWSLGATVVLDIAQRYPEKVASLVLLSGNPMFTQSEQWPGMRVDLLEAFAAQLHADCQATLLRFLSLQVNQLPDFKLLLKKLKAAVVESTTPDAQTLQGGLDILKTADLRTALAETNVPVSVILGTRDTLVPVAVGQKLQALAPLIELTIIDKAGHVPFLSHPQALIDIISTFMADRTHDKSRIKQSFAKAASTYDGVAALQRQVGRALLTSVELEHANGVLLDLGCGTGFLTSALVEGANHQQLIAVDIAHAMLKTTQTKLVTQADLNYVCADAEFLPFATASVDHLFSNLALQWCNNLTAVFTDIKRVLKPEGQLVFSTFGPNTLQELKAAWSSVDHYPHVNDFYSTAQVQAFLEQAGFTDIQCISQSYVSYYHTVKALMQELKGLGAQQVAGRNKSMTTKTAMQNMFVAYDALRINEQIPATFEVISVIAKG